MAMGLTPSLAPLGGLTPGGNRLEDTFDDDAILRGSILNNLSISFGSGGGMGYLPISHFNKRKTKTPDV